MKAVGKYIVVKETEGKSTETKGGLLLSSKQKEDIRYREAKVLKVGTEVIGLKEKDNIYFDRHAGFDIELDDKIYKVIKEQDVVIIL
jgi:co-chaperonin GroES (HSP10)